MPLSINTPTDICNNALLMIGDKTISSVDDNAVEAAVTFNNVYNTIRKNLLSMDNWLFAMTRIKLEKVLIPLSSSGNDIFNLYGYKNQFILPIDYINVVEVMDINRRPQIWNNPLIKLYIIEDRYIYSDQENLILSYIYDNEDIVTYSAPFISCLICNIAMFFSKQFHNTDSELQKLQFEFDQQLHTAKKFNCRAMQSSGIISYPMLTEMMGSI